MTIAPDALLAAIRSRDVDEIDRLLAHAPALRQFTGPGGESLVMHACYVGAPDIAPQLLGPRAPSAAEAAALGDIRALEQAIAYSPDDLTRHTADGWTPLHLACFFGRDVAVQLLIREGAPLHALSKNTTFNTPLHAAIAGSGSYGLVESLIVAGADVMARGEANITPLHIAAARGNHAVCDLLLAHGADVDAVMIDGTTPAMMATSREHIALADRLREG